MRPLGGPLASDVAEAADPWHLRPGILAAFGIIVRYSLLRRERIAWRLEDVVFHGAAHRPLVLHLVPSGRDERSCPVFYLLSLSRISHHEARLLIDPLVRRSRQLQCHRRRIVPLVEDGLEATSGNRFSDELFAQVILIIPLSCRLFSAASAGIVLGGIVPEPDCGASGCFSRTFPQVGSVAEQCQRLVQAQGGTVPAPPLVPRWYCDFAPFPGMENNRKPRSGPGLVR